MVGNDFGHKQRYFVRRIELARLFARIGGKHTYQIFVYKAENVIILLAVHRNNLDQLNKLANCLRLRTRAVAQLAEPRFQRFEYVLKQLFTLIAD